MNPFGVVGHHYDTPAIAAWNNSIRRARAEYELHHFADARLSGPESMEAVLTCDITMWKTVNGSNRHGSWPYVFESRCGEQVHSFSLCAKHAADKVRLGGAA